MSYNCIHAGVSAPAGLGRQMRRLTEIHLVFIDIFNVLNHSLQVFYVVVELCHVPFSRAFCVGSEVESEGVETSRSQALGQELVIYLVLLS